MKTILISAGEISGDLHGAKLVAAIQSIEPDVRFIGMGHHKMRAQGVQTQADLAGSSTIGFIEPLRYLPQILKTFFKMKRLLRILRPDLIVVIDYQGYHMPFIKAAKKLGLPVIYYIAPQEWQWGTKQGGRKVVAVTDLILAIFREEAVFYQRLGGQAIYIGHPLLDIAVANLSKEDFYRKYQIDYDHKILTIFPGSRPQEIKHILPVLLGAAKNLQKQIPKLQIILSVVSPFLESSIRQETRMAGIQNVLFYHDHQYDLIQHTYLSLLASGTITLEHACLGTPFIANYRFSALSFWVVKTFFAKKLRAIKFISLPNIFLNKAIVPEFIQTDCTVANLTQQALVFFNDPALYQKIKQEFSAVRDLLGTPGSIKRAADEIVRILNTKKG